MVYSAYASSKQFLNITFLLVSFASTSTAAVFLTVIVPLASIYALLESHKLELFIDFLNLT